MSASALRILNRFWIWLSLALLLYCMGLGCVMVAYAQQAVQHTRLSLPIYLELEDGAEESAIFALQKKLAEHPAVHAPSITYTSAADALANWNEEEMGVSKEEVLIAGQNPLPNTLVLTVSPQYEEDHALLVEELMKEPILADAYYTEVPLEEWSYQVRQAEALLLVVLLFFGIIVVTLLRSHIRLAWREPDTSGLDTKERRQWYRRQGVRNGLLAAVVAVLGVWATRWWLESNMTLVDYYSELEFWTSLTTAGMLLLGALLPWWAARYRPTA